MSLSDYKSASEARDGKTPEMNHTIIPGTAFEGLGQPETVLTPQGITALAIARALEERKEEERTQTGLW